VYRTGDTRNAQDAHFFTNSEPMKAGRRGRQAPRGAPFFPACCPFVAFFRRAGVYRAAASRKIPGMEFFSICIGIRP
jgi:hypothetical protein